VMAAVELAKAFGLRVSAQGTGHNAAPLGPLEDTVLVKTERMRGIEIDPEAQVARIDAGVRSVELVEAAAQHGLAPLAGSSPDVGVVGYTLGGGLSWFGRKHGLAASHVHAIELVTADGRLVRADREHEPELFWALRGGGGSFGIVTALELRLIPVREAYAGILWWPIERDREVLHATGDGILLEKLPPEAIDELNQTAGAASSSPLISLEVRHSAASSGGHIPTAERSPPSTPTTFSTQSASPPPRKPRRKSEHTSRSWQTPYALGPPSTPTSTSPRPSGTRTRSGPRRPSSGTAASKRPSTRTT
jgi:FAD binding domain